MAFIPRLFTYLPNCEAADMQMRVVTQIRRGELADSIQSCPVGAKRNGGE